MVQIKAPAELKDPWDLVKIIKTVPGDEAFRPLSESECPLLKKRAERAVRGGDGEMLSGDRDAVSSVFVRLRLPDKCRT